MSEFRTIEEHLKTSPKSGGGGGEEQGLWMMCEGAGGWEPGAEVIKCACSILLI